MGVRPGGGVLLPAGPALSSAMPPLEPISPSAWNARAARHLLNRAGFGIPLSEAARLAALTPEAAVADLVDYEKFEEAGPEPDWLEHPAAMRRLHVKAENMAKLNAGKTGLNDEQRRSLEESRRKAVNQLEAKEREDIERLKMWWLRRMRTTRRPLEEKMTLFWHGHFAVSAEKVQSGAHNYGLNRIFRNQAAGNFKKLARETGASPAMLRYLDNDQNHKDHPNENWARELMELFTLGPGNYTEDDIKNAARAFTGWTSDGEKFVYRPEIHDEGEKTFMGRKGNFGGDDILDIIFEKKEASLFLARKLWRFFVREDLDEPAVEALAGTIREGGYELKPALRRLFLSREFYAPESMDAVIKSPAQLVVSMVSLLELNEPAGGFADRYAVQAMRAMGQDLFYPPNVKGWDGGRAWINTNALMVRYNVPNFFTQGVAADLGGPGGGVQRYLQQARAEMDKAKKRARRPVFEANAMDSNMMMEEGSMTMNSMAGEGEAGGGMELGAGVMEMDWSRVGVVGDSNGPKGFRLPATPFDALRFFARAEGLPLREVAGHLADYFYGRPAAPERLAEVIASLAGSGSPDAPLRVESADPERLRGTIRLLLSCADFQVC